jgi:hypothetical protein
MRLPAARHTERLRQVVGSYRDGVGLTEIGGFHDHDGHPTAAGTDGAALRMLSRG